MLPSSLRLPLLLLVCSPTACGDRSPLDVTLLSVDGGATFRDANAPDAPVDAPPDVGVDAACGMPPPPPSLCTNPQGGPSGLGLAGTLDGVAVESTLCTEIAGSLDLVTSGAPYSSVFAELSAPGQALVGAFAYAGSAEASIESAIFGYDSSSPLDVDWYCAGPGSTIAITSTMEGDMAGPASLVGMTRLGACSAAAPVAGSLELDGTDELELTLGAATTAYPMANGTEVSSATTQQIEAAGLLPTGEDAFVVVLWFDGTLQLTAGMALMGPDGPDPGAVYCITSGTSTQPPPGGLSTFSAGGLRRLGTCAGATPPRGCSQLELEWVN